ncbi:hypothetical protein MC885_009713, partial [Smutsia gigantea]
MQIFAPWFDESRTRYMIGCLKSQNIFQVKHLECQKQELPGLKRCLCPTVSHFVPSSLCGEPSIHVDANSMDNVE